MCVYIYVCGSALACLRVCARVISVSVHEYHFVSVSFCQGSCATVCVSVYPSFKYIPCPNKIKPNLHTEAFRLGKGKRVLRVNSLLYDYLPEFSQDKFPLNRKSVSDKTCFVSARRCCRSSVVVLQCCRWLAVGPSPLISRDSGPQQ